MQISRLFGIGREVVQLMLIENPSGQCSSRSVTAGGRTTPRLEAPGWLAQLYVGTVVHVDKGSNDHTNVTSSPLASTANECESLNRFLIENAANDRHVGG